MILNFLFFDKWALYSSEEQINTYIKNKNTKNLKEIAKDNNTYQIELESFLVNINDLSEVNSHRIFGDDIIYRSPIPQASI